MKIHNLEKDPGGRPAWIGHETRLSPRREEKGSGIIRAFLPIQLFRPGEKVPERTHWMRRGETTSPGDVSSNSLRPAGGRYGFLVRVPKTAISPERGIVRKKPSGRK